MILRIRARKKSYSKLNVIIKPTEEARYKNVVDAFDEMKITNVALYVLLDISEQEKEFLKNPAGGLQFSLKSRLKQVQLSKHNRLRQPLTSLKK